MAGKTAMLKFGCSYARNLRRLRPRPADTCWHLDEMVIRVQGRLMRYTQIALLRVELEDTRPTIWRRLAVPLSGSLGALHDAIQAAFGWQDYHLFEFAVGGSEELAGRRYGMPLPEGDDRKVYQARTTKLGALVIGQGFREFVYTYDFGDNWRHRVVVEAVADPEPGESYPLFLDGARKAPPEDVGGVPGFEDFLKAITKSRHREHKRMIEWHGGPFDPEDIGRRDINARMSKLARRRLLGQLGFEKSQGRMS